MKVLYLIPGLGMGGGAERSLLDLAPGLTDAGIDLSIAYFHDRSSSALDAFLDLGVRVDRISSAGMPARAREVHRLIVGRRPDVLHTTLYEADIVGRWAAVGTGTRVLASLVNTSYVPARYTEDVVPRWRLETVRHYEGLTLRRLCDHVHVNSQAVADAAVAAFHLDPAMISVVHRGRDPARLERATPERRLAARAELGLDPDAIAILSVGRHEPQKGQIHLVRALPAVLQEHPEAVLLVAGREGSVTASLVNEARASGVTDHIRFLGNRDDIGGVLAASDLLAFPSLWEGLPGTIIEAMAVGTPIVASTIGPVTELVDDRSARLVPPSDPSALAAAILAVLEDPAAAADRAEAGHRLFLDHLTVEHAYAGMAELYRQVAEMPLRRWGARPRR